MPGLGHAVAFEDAVARTLAKALEDLGQERRGTGHEEAHSRAALPCQGRLREHARVHRGNAHKDSRARERFYHVVRVETRVESNPARIQHGGIGGDVQTVHVEDGERV